MGEQAAMDYFTTALDDRELELKVREREPKDLETAFKHAVRLEALEKAVDSTANRENVRRRDRGQRDDALIRRVTELEQRAAASAMVTELVQVAPPFPNSQSSINGEELSMMRRQMDEMSKELRRLRLLEMHREAERIVAPSSNEQLDSYRIYLLFTSNGSSQYARNPAPQVPSQPYCGNRPVRGNCYNSKQQGHLLRDCQNLRMDQSDSQRYSELQT